MALFLNARMKWEKKTKKEENWRQNEKANSWEMFSFLV